MSEILLQTKLFKPVLRPSRVHRPRLIDKLNKGLPGKLSLISAPAGFGKTTVVAEWLENLQRPFGWLSLDEEDNDPHRFFVYVAAALKVMTGGIELLQPSPELSIKAMTAILVNNLIQLSEPGVLVLDDYHLIESASIHEALTFLCNHLPPSLHLVLMMRSDPPLPLARMRARGELNEVREKDLRFTEQEAGVFLNQIMGLNLTAQDIATLEARTEGWIASLQLAALSLQDASDVTQLINAFGGTHHYIVDYLVEEVLAQRPPGTREFLLKTSILNRLSAPLCDALLTGGQAQQTLEQLHAANYFLVPLDNERRWYRYHHLFADVLRQRVAQTYVEELPGLYQQATRWFVSQGYLTDAIEMALAGSDYDFAATLILQAAETVIWDQGEWLLLDRWLTSLPPSLVRNHPRLCLYHAWGFLVRGQMAAATARLVDAERAMLNLSGIEQQAHPALAQGELAAMRATIARFQGRQPQVVAQANIALSNLPQGDNPWRAMTLLNLGAAHFLGDDQAAADSALVEAWQLALAKNHAMWGCVSGSFLAQLQMRAGRYQDAQRIYEQARTMASQQKQESIFNIGMTDVGLGLLWMAWNDLAKAEPFLQQGLRLGTTVQNMLLILSGTLALARLRQVQGDFDAAKPLLLQAQEMAQNPGMNWSWVHVSMMAHLVRAWIHQGDLLTARRLLETAVEDATGQPEFWKDSLELALARLLMAEERWLEAERLLGALWEKAVSRLRIQSQIEVRMLQAMTQSHLGQEKSARISLQEALVLARPSGEIRLFLDEGQPMQGLISTLHFDDAALQAYLQKITEAFPGLEISQIEQANRQLVEPLTARELELLALVAGGMTNHEIAAQLFISYGTVRRHLNNIYGKLAVNDRSQAILKAQERHLV